MILTKMCAQLLGTYTAISDQIKYLSKFLQLISAKWNDKLWDDWRLESVVVVRTLPRFSIKRLNVFSSRYRVQSNCKDKI